ncbi:MAG: transcription antitermination factor NusB [Chitinophagales bacterium]
MIKRRSVRIKVFQAIYGFEHSNGLPLKDFSKQLKASIESIKAIYLYNLLLLRAMAESVENEWENINAKHIKTAQDQSFNTKMLSNTFLSFLINDEVFNDAVSRYNLIDKIDDVLVQNLYIQLKQSEAYADYLASPENFNAKEDVALIKYIYQDIFLQNDDFHAHIQDIWSNWIDDAQLISMSIITTIEKSKNRLILVTSKESFADKLEELTSFGDELFTQVVNNKVSQMELISSKLKNWDVERLASTDIYILRLALAELMYFPSIPTKVTINEYIDIAKEYSTPKSKEFVNGILDNLTKELSVKGLIIKEGRGLKDS